MTLDDATQRYLAQLLNEAPPLDADQRALVVRLLVDTRVAPATAHTALPQRDAA